MLDPTKRWHVKAIYSGKPNDCVLEADVEELEEIQDLVESWPDWRSLKEVKITYNEPSSQSEIDR